VLALIGDRYHNVDYIRLNFNRVFSELGMPYEYTTNYEWFVDEEATAELLEGRKLFIFGRDGWSSGWLRRAGSSDGVVTALMDAPPTASGTWVTEGWRWPSTALSVPAGPFSRGTTTSVSPITQVHTGKLPAVPMTGTPRTTVEGGGGKRRASITQGMGDFMVTDEQHFPIYERTPGDLLLRGANIDGLSFDTDSGAAKRATVSATAWRTPMARGGLS